MGSMLPSARTSTAGGDATLCSPVTLAGAERARGGTTSAPMGSRAPVHTSALSSLEVMLC